DDPPAREQAVAARGRPVVEVRHVDPGRRDASLRGEGAMRLLQQRPGPRDDAIDPLAVERNRLDRLRDLAPVAPDRDLDGGLLRRLLDLAEGADELSVDAEQYVARAEEVRGRRAAHRARDGEDLAPPRAVGLVLLGPRLRQRELARG